MIDYQSFRAGNFVGPLSALTDHSLLEDADPAIFAALDFYRAILTTHLSERFSAEMNRDSVGRADLDGYVVRTVLPYDPIVFLPQAQFTFPLLAVYRVSERYTQRTSVWYQIESKWGVDYVMPPLDSGQFEQVAPTLQAVARILVDRTARGYDPSYNASQLVWADCGVAEINVTSADYTFLHARDKSRADIALPFPTLHLELDVIEREAATGEFETLDSIGGAIYSDGYHFTDFNITDP